MTITERELIGAINATGREIASRTLSDWRQCGLLPALSARSRGLHKGKACYWPDDSTLDRAILVHDLLANRFKKQDVYWILWLCGFSVPLTHLRRAWFHKARQPKPWKVREAELPAEITRRAIRRTSAALGMEAKIAQNSWVQTVVHAVLASCASLDASNQPEIDALIEACKGLFDSLDLPELFDGRPGEIPIALLLKTVWSALKSSDLICVATDTELREAQKIASIALRVLERRSQRHARNDGRQEQIRGWPIAEALAFGSPLFFFILAIARSGQSELLDSILHLLPSNDRPEARQGKTPIPAEEPLQATLGRLELT